MDYSPEYTWIFACTIIIGFFTAYGIGANDVANAFGSSVGAKALTMKQAIVVAAFCEFGGAVLLGAGVTGTIKSGIAKTSAYTAVPDILMYGMMCAVFAAGIWLLAACYWELPVSTTHSIVGAIVGMSVTAEGFNSVVWYAHKSTFPYVDGVAGIVLSWVFSPILSAIAAMIIFLGVRTAVLRRPNSYFLSLWLLPFFTALTFWIVAFFIVQKGVNNGSSLVDNKVSDGKAAWIAACIAGGAALFSAVVGVPLIKYKVRRDLEAEEQRANGDAEAGEKKGEEAAESAEGAAHTTPGFLEKMRKSKVWKAVAYSSNHDIHDEIETNAEIGDIHANCEVFDNKTELSFRYLQVFTACANSFAHGSNDVANAMGPLAAVYGIWQTGTVVSKSKVPIWILVIGGAGIVVGLATYGYKIMRVLGVKMTKLTNSRGFSVEMASAIVVIISSRYGLPVSTTHCLVGAVTGIGLVETFLGSHTQGARTFNFKILIKFFAGWVATLIVAALTAAAFTAQGIYAPGKFDRTQLNAATSFMNATALTLGTNWMPFNASECTPFYQNTTNCTNEVYIMVNSTKAPINTAAQMTSVLTFALESALPGWSTGGSGSCVA